MLITSPVVGDARITRLIALNEKADGLKVVTDNPGVAEALAAREAFVALSAAEQDRVVEFLKSLRVARPGQAVRRR